MSHTVSRGYHTARRWRTVAISTEEQLRTFKADQFGAWVALERFFVWVLEGLGEEPRRAPLMAGVCALSIFTQVLSGLNQRISPELVERKTRKYLGIIRETREQKKTKTNDVQELRHFLLELARQGNL
jgi:hypothetical protein